MRASPLLLLAVLAGSCAPARDTAEQPIAPLMAADDRTPQGLSDADYAAHIETLRERLPHDQFTIVIEKPFVVVGDESAETVRRRAKNTVGWAVTQLKAEYFARDPEHILDVWLFKDKESYEEHARQLFSTRPSTPFGYYSSVDRALVMNIATGGGTLVHEIVHPFMEANFPACPPWFNEGLGSLYEQSAERDGVITGLTNWRLRGLKEAILNDALPSFEVLCSMSPRSFYGGGRGDNYAQARYLLYYLQEEGLLREFYQEFTKNAADDPTGFETLRGLLGDRGEDMSAFQNDWELWALDLQFP